MDFVNLTYLMELAPTVGIVIKGDRQLKYN